MSTYAQALAPIVSLALLLGLPGCRGEHDDHDHDHDHGHAEHVDPPHWPIDFPDAVARLIAGHAESRDALAVGRGGETLDGLLHIQRDLARWLPEVAADSDMPEEPWNRVDAIASRLLAAYESVIADLDAGRFPGDDRLARVEPTLEELERLNAEADPGWFPRRTFDRAGGRETIGQDESVSDEVGDAA